MLNGQSLDYHLMSWVIGPMTLTLDLTSMGGGCKKNPEIVYSVESL